MNNELTAQFLGTKGLTQKEIKAYFRNLKNLRKAVNDNFSLEPASEKMWELSGGLRFYYQEWPSTHKEHQDIPRAIIFVFHNIYGSSDIFYPLADFLRNEGFLVVGYDYRGHGRTGGQAGGILGDISSFQSIFYDAKELITHYKTKYAVPIFFVGYDIGSLVALNLAYQIKEPIIEGIVLISPIWKLEQNLKHMAIYPLLSVGTLFSKKEGRQKVIEEDLESTYYEEYHEYSKTNFLRLKSMSFRFFKTVLDLIRKTHRFGKKLNIPSIIFQGTQDKIVNHYSVHRLYDKWKHPNKKIRLYENTGHNLLMDKFTHSLYQETLDFITNLLKP